MAVRMWQRQTAVDFQPDIDNNSALYLLETSLSSDFIGSKHERLRKEVDCHVFLNSLSELEMHEDSTLFNDCLSLFWKY